MLATCRTRHAHCTGDVLLTLGSGSMSSAAQACQVSPAALRGAWSETLHPHSSQIPSETTKCEGQSCGKDLCSRRGTPDSRRLRTASRGQAGERKLSESSCLNVPMLHGLYEGNASLKCTAQRLKAATGCCCAAVVQLWGELRLPLLLTVPFNVHPSLYWAPRAAALSSSSSSLSLAESSSCHGPAPSPPLLVLDASDVLCTERLWHFKGTEEVAKFGGKDLSIRLAARHERWC